MATLEEYIINSFDEFKRVLKVVRVNDIEHTQGLDIHIDAGTSLENILKWEHIEKYLGYEAGFVFWDIPNRELTIDIKEPKKEGAGNDKRKNRKQRSNPPTTEDK